MRTSDLMPEKITTDKINVKLKNVRLDKGQIKYLFSYLARLHLNKEAHTEKRRNEKREGLALIDVTLISTFKKIKVQQERRFYRYWW